MRIVDFDLWCGLMTGIDMELDEGSALGYKRQAVSVRCVMHTLDGEETCIQLANTSEVVFPQALASWPLVTHVAFFLDAFGGSPIAGAGFPLVPYNRCMLPGERLVFQQRALLARRVD